MEYPSYQPYSGNQGYESCLSTYQPEYSNHHPSYTKFYPDQTCPDQPQCQPHLQQSREPTPDENYNANSAAGKTEEVTAFQLDVRSCPKSEVEMIMELQHTYEEQQSHMDNMIGQVALLAEMIKEMKENRAKSVENGNAEMDEGIKAAKVGEKSEALPEQGNEEIGADEGDVQIEGESMTTPPENEVSKEILEKACDESHGNDETVKREEDIDNIPLYLQLDKVQAPKENMEESTSMVEEEIHRQRNHL